VGPQALRREQIKRLAAGPGGNTGAHSGKP